MKKLRILLAIIAELLCSVMVEAHDFEEGGIYYNIKDRMSLTVEVTTQGSGMDIVYGKYSGNVIVPQTVTHNDTTYIVTGIGFRAFYECSNLVSVELPKSLTYIGTGAFAYCSRLTDIIIPDNVTDISSSAFWNCN